MQKISELLNIEITENNPLTIYHPIFKNKKVYWEDSDGFCYKQEYDSNDNRIYFENNDGIIEDNRITELTLDQIAEKFNISVNQLKIKK